MHGICFSFKVWKDFLLVRGRREPSKPRFGALRTSRTKKSDDCRKSLYFQKYQKKFKENLQKYTKNWNEAAIIPFYIRGTCIIIFVSSSFSVGFLDCLFNLCARKKLQNTSTSGIPMLRAQFGKFPLQKSSFHFHFLHF